MLKMLKILNKLSILWVVSQKKEKSICLNLAYLAKYGFRFRERGIKIRNITCRCRLE